MCQDKAVTGDEAKARQVKLGDVTEVNARTGYTRVHRCTSYPSRPFRTCSSSYCRSNYCLLSTVSTMQTTRATGGIK